MVLHHEQDYVCYAIQWRSGCYQIMWMKIALFYKTIMWINMLPIVDIWEAVSWNMFSTNARLAVEFIFSASYSLFTYMHSSTMQNDMKSQVFLSTRLCTWAGIDFAIVWINTWNRKKKTKPHVPCMQYIIWHGWVAENLYVGNCSTTVSFYSTEFSRWRQVFWIHASGTKRVG